VAAATTRGSFECGPEEDRRGAGGAAGEVAEPGHQVRNFRSRYEWVGSGRVWRGTGCVRVAYWICRLTNTRSGG
jgi:hypothetical protein